MSGAKIIERAGAMPRSQAKLQKRALALLDKVILLARDVEAAFGKDDDRTIFARNAYCELEEVRRMLGGKGEKRRRKDEAST
jgi:hypothetical protein